MSAGFPMLRSDLNLYPAPRLHNGSPSWTLHDPAANRFFRLGWMEFEFLKRWGSEKLDVILRVINQETTLSPDQEDFEVFAGFLTQNNLLETSPEAKTKSFVQQIEARKIKPLQWLIKNYLFMRIPLVKPDRFLSWFLPHVSPFFKRSVLQILLLCTFVGAFLIVQDWAEFLRGFRILQTPAGLTLAFFVLAFAKVIHELGHALASKYYGCRVPAMGLALIVLWPLLWTDTTEGWKLQDRKKRLMIDGAGMIAELGLAAIASILWAVSPDGDFKTAMHLLATTSWIMTIAVNANPFMRFDGYYLLADATDIPNIQERSFALAKWRIRKLLFALKSPPPEHFRPQQEDWLIAYAIGTWVYRFFLFLGIALLVYHLFFKVLGVALFVVELWWFIGKPIIGEIKAWKVGMNHIKNTRRAVFYKCLLLIVLFVLFLPTPYHINAPAILKLSNEVPIVTSSAARLIKTHVTNGDTVEEGQLLFTFESPEIEKQLRVNQLAIKSLKKDLSQSAISSQYFSRANMQKQDLMRLMSEQERLISEQQKLEIKSPYSGVFRDASETLSEGVWIQKHEFLGLVAAGHVVVEAYVSEQDIHRVTPHINADFTSYKTLNATKGEVSSIDASSVSFLRNEELASIHGGEIPVKSDINGRLKPEYKVYKVNVTAYGQHNFLQSSSIGNAKINAGWRSFGWSYMKKMYSIFIRESGL